METCAVILSGGMDSSTLLHHAVDIYGKKNVTALTFQYGQRHWCEILSARDQANLFPVTHEIHKISVLGQLTNNSALTGDTPVPHGHYEEESMKDTVVANRNMVLLSLAMSYCMNHKITNLWYGAHGGDHAIYPDCRPEFLEMMQKLALIADWHSVALQAPFLTLDKAGILKTGFQLGVDYSKTWTCYEGSRDKGACGKCGACQERLEAFEKVGREDPLRYRT